MANIRQDTLITPWTPVLRTLGVRLDAIAARNVMILDAGTDLVVRCNTRSYAESLAWSLSYEELGREDDELITRRTPLPRESHNPPASSGYADLLRLVGSVLDAERRWLVLFDEQPDSIVMSFLYFDLARALSPQKECIIVPRRELSEMHDKALSRRARSVDESSVLRRFMRPRSG
jgi:hypothetical protein